MAAQICCAESAAQHGVGLITATLTTRVLLFALAVLCVGNLNGVAYMLAGVSQAFSALIVLIAVALVATSYNNIPRLGWYTSGFAVLFLLLALIFSAAYTSMTHWQYVFGPVGFALLVLATSGGTATLPGDQVSRLLRHLCWLLALISVATVLSPYIVAFYKTAPLDALRSSGVFLNPNTAAVVANIGFALCLSYFFDSQRRVFLVLALISAAATFVTFSKAGLVTLGALTILAVVVAPSQKRRYAFFAIMVIAAFAGLLYFLSVPNLHELQLQRIVAAGKILLAGMDDELSTGRTVVWQVAANQISEHGVIQGAGLGAMRAIEGGVYQRGAWQGAHNFWLVLIGEGGLIPAVAFATLLLALVVASIRLRHSRYFVVSYVAILLADTMAAHHIFEMRYHAFFVGLVIGVIYTNRRDTPHAYPRLGKGLRDSRSQMILGQSN